MDAASAASAPSLTCRDMRSRSSLKALAGDLAADIATFGILIKDSEKKLSPKLELESPCRMT